LALSSSERPFFTATTSLADGLAGRSLLRVPEAASRWILCRIAAGRELPTVSARLLRCAARSSHTGFLKHKAMIRDTDANSRWWNRGKVTIDELFQLGIERDNDLWLRGHSAPATVEKVLPLGRRYFLANWEMDKNIDRTASSL